jgi:hypothetical protein
MRKKLKKALLLSAFFSTPLLSVFQGETSALGIKMQESLSRMHHLKTATQENLSSPKETYSVSEDRNFAIGFPADGRLTVESGVPISTTDQLAKTTIYYTPYLGNRIALYDGTKWMWDTFSQLSLSLGTLTASSTYDVFIYDNSGTPTLEWGSAWTNANTRSNALTTQDGVLVLSGQPTRRYLGSVGTMTTTTTEDSLRARNVWNFYNRVPRPLLVQEPTDSWSQTGAFAFPYNNCGGGAVYCGIYFLSPWGALGRPFMDTLSLVTSDNNLSVKGGWGSSATNSFRAISAHLGYVGGRGATYMTQSWGFAIEVFPSSRGFAKYYYNEQGNTNGFFYGDAGDASGRTQSGMQGWVEG